MSQAGSHGADPRGRRAFLRFAVAAGGAGLLASCSGNSRSTPAGPTARSSPGSTGSSAASRAAGSAGGSGVPPSAADWTALGHDLSGTLVRPGEAAYAVAKRQFDPRFDSLHPAGIAYCRNPHDVSTCLAFVRKYGVPVAARSGGHSYAGWSSTSGLIVDVTPMAGVNVSGSTATVGAGTRLADFYNGLSAHGRVVPGGSCPTVGIAGLTLGGGVGVVSRAYGLTSDNLTSLQIVTADGLVRTCSASSNPDLFWACRGGGGGNFGVVTSFTYRTYPASEIILFFLSWPWSAAARVISAWQSWAPHAPDELWSNLHLAAAPGGSNPTIQVGGTYLGGTSAAYAQLEKLYAAVGEDPSSPFLEVSPSWLHAMLVEAGCASLTVNECHLPSQVRQVGFLHQAAEQRRDRHLAVRRAEPAAGERRVRRGGRDSVRRARRRGQPRRPWRHRVRAPRRAVPGPVHDHLADGRGGRRGGASARVAAVVLAVDAPVRQRPGVPELHRPGPDQLAAGLLRCQLQPAGPGQGQLRPRQGIYLPAGDLAIS
ncbi:MAG: FAD-dependent oxidoreductase [Streptosporangiaceae bacterium]